MKVKDLEKGILVRAQSSWTPQIRVQYVDDSNEKLPLPFRYISMLRAKARRPPYTYNVRKITRNPTMLYLESKRLQNFTVWGYKTFHFFLMEGECVALTGHDARCLEPISRKNQ